MTEHPTAIFADQVKPGMRVGSAYAGEPGSAWTEVVLITQVRDQTDDFFGHPSRTMHLLGVHDDGRPFSYVAGPQLALHLFGAPLIEGAQR